MEMKPNFTQIPNVILDEWMAIAEPIDSIILFAICRKIYGWHKLEDGISQSQLMAMTGLSRNRVKKGLKFWIDAKVLVCTGKETKTTSRRYKLILCDNFNKDINKSIVNDNGVSQHDSHEGHSVTVRGSQRDSQEGHGVTVQKKDKETYQNIFLNKEAEFQKNKHNEIAVKEYVVNNSAGDVQPSRITNQINDWFITLWKEYYKMPYKADLFETDRLAHELDHDWDSFLTLVKAFQTDQYWAKVSMSPRMLRKAWDKLGSRAKVSENQSREIRRKEIDTYEQKILEHEQHKKELKQVADNWKPWNLKADFEKMVGKK